MLVPLYKYSYVYMYVCVCIAYFDMYKQTHADIHAYIFIFQRSVYMASVRGATVQFVNRIEVRHESLWLIYSLLMLVSFKVNIMLCLLIIMLLCEHSPIHKYR